MSKIVYIKLSTKPIPNPIPKSIRIPKPYTQTNPLKFILNIENILFIESNNYLY